MERPWFFAGWKSDSEIYLSIGLFSLKNDPFFIISIKNTLFYYINMDVESASSVGKICPYLYLVIWIFCKLARHWTGSDVEMGVCTNKLSLGNQTHTKSSKGNQSTSAEDGTFSTCILRHMLHTSYAHHNKQSGPEEFFLSKVIPTNHQLPIVTFFIK